MGYYSLRTFVVVALAASASSQQTPPANINQHFEVDTVFPRPVEQTFAMEDLQTFKANEIIPLVIAVQNLGAWTLGNLTMVWQWYIQSVPANGTRGRILDVGVFDTTDAATKNPAFLVAVTNSSTWYQNTTRWQVSPKAPGETYLFQWTASFYAANNSCYFRYPDVPNLYVWKTASVFDVLSESEEQIYLRARRPTSLENVTTAEVAIPQAPECPELGGLYQATFNETATDCQLGVVAVEGIQGNPCAAQVDSIVAHSISSRVASSISAWTAPPTTTRTGSAPTSTSRGGAGVAQPVQTAMAAACILCGLALS
ncbi:hypothetical protein N657DRAFT_688192 [Parathielavia appendiculata]|uniref:DUF7136 domain-containing protein n=1 Tax=Parathielavia appendiculata TaxID=2587402 RepID=A0AAN6U2V3_9PEZI|nr:hypothetical protein N657DRAFT_688192 [Parathielavia appendiculata]